MTTKDPAVRKIEKLYKSKEYKELAAKEDLLLFLAIRIKQIREEKGWTQKELADRMQVKQPTVARLEKGTAGITVNTLAKFCAATGKKLEFVYD